MCLLEVFGDESGVGDLSWYRRDHEGPGHLRETKDNRCLILRVKVTQTALSPAAAKNK